MTIIDWTPELFKIPYNWNLKFKLTAEQLSLSVYSVGAIWTVSSYWLSQGDYFKVKCPNYQLIASDLYTTLSQRCDYSSDCKMARDDNLMNFIFLSHILTQSANKTAYYCKA